MTALSATEIELGRLAIERSLATRDQVRECAELKSAGNSEHLARLLVSRGYIAEDAARRLFQEIQQGSRAGSSAGIQSSAGPHGTQVARAPYAAGSSPGTAPYGAGAQAGAAQPPTSPGYAPGGSAYGPAGGSAYGPAGGSAYGPAGGSAYGPAGGSAYGPAGGSAYGPAGGSAYGPAGGSAYGAAVGPHGTHAQRLAPGSGSGYGPNGGVAGSGYGPNGGVAGSGFGPNGGVAGSGFGAGTGVAASNFAQPASGSGSNGGGEAISGDDPIAMAMSTRTAADGSTETVFGPYDILGEIARGGMGIVYRARQRSLKRIVALKVMKEGENASEKQIRRFKRETEAAAKLQHPNIVAVHEVGCHQGFHYFTMDIIEGDPLDAIVKRKEKMPVQQVLEIVKETAQAIDYAHGKGIIHRDLKPANVLLDTDGHAKVTDFGLAKQIDHKSMLTRTGAVVGTPFYMPPEQARGDVDIDQRADVYALGVILYELLTLKLPFHGETTMEVYHKILEEEPTPPRKHDSRVDRDVDTIVLKAMDKDVHRRYQTAQELAEDIQRYLNGDPIKARPLGPIGRAIKKAKKNLPIVIVGSVVIFAALATVGLAIWSYQREEAQKLADAKNRERESFLTQVDTQCINARTQITSAIARQRDRDATGALADLEEAERILDDLKYLPEELAEKHTIEELEGFLTEKDPEVAKIYQEVYLETGRAHALKGTDAGYKDALAAFDRGLGRCESDRTEVALRIRLEAAKVRALSGEFDVALKAFADVLEADPGMVDARLELGRAHAMAGDHPKALECFTDVIRSEPKTIRAYLLRGGVLFELHRYEEALQDFNKVLDLQEDLFEGYVWRGRVHHALGHAGEAQDDLTEAIDITPSLPDGYYHRAELHFSERRLQQAIKDYEVAISRSPRYYAAYIGLGRAHEWSLEYDRAREQYQDVIKAQDREAEAFRPLALTALARLDLAQADPEECLLEAEEELRRAAATPDGNLGPPPEQAALTEAAKRLSAQRLAAARQELDRALAAPNPPAMAWITRGRLALLEDDAARAQAAVDKALAALAARPHARHGDGSGPVVEVSQGDEGDDGWGDDEDDGWGDDDGWDDDEDDTSVGAEVGDVELAAAHLLAGQIARKAEAWGKARKAFRAARAADPSSAAARAGLGHVDLAQGKEDAARDSFLSARDAARAGVSESGYFFQEGTRLAELAERSKKPEVFQQARTAYARALQRNPFHALAALGRARLCRDWGAFDPAVRLAATATGLDPFYREAYELTGFLFARDLPEAPNQATGRPVNVRDAARGAAAFDKALEVATGDAVPADAHFGRALAILAQVPADAVDDPRIAAAKQDLEQALTAVPKPGEFRSAEPRQIKAAIDYIRLYVSVHERVGDAAGAEAARQQLAAVREGAVQAAQAELKEGEDLRDALDYAAAIRHFDRAIELDPEFSKAYYERGTCYLKIGNFVPGILDFSRALELDPRIADQVYNKVYQISYVVDLNRVITELNKIVGEHPDVSYVVFLRGFFYVAKTEFKQVEREDLDAGIADFDRCLELNPTHVTAFLYRGFLWMKMADREAEQATRNAHYQTAMTNYARALELDPESGISHYLQALCWSVMSTEEDCDEEEALARRLKAIAELKLSFESDFKGHERIRNEKGFEPIRGMDEFKALMER